jgi:NhaA family Na+:H+ antiporter
MYGDYLCPYCRRLRPVLGQLRGLMGDRMIYAFRHFPNERAHPGATFASLAAEAAGRQGKFWAMHDALYEAEPPLTHEVIADLALDIGLDMDRFAADVERDDLLTRVERDLQDGRDAGVAVTPTIYIDELRYDGAWDFHSLLEAMQRPLGAKLERAAKVFANFPASAGLVLLLSAVLALVLANTSLAPVYHAIVGAELGLVAPGASLSLTIGEWASEGLLTFFFLLVGLGIRREMTTGPLTDWRAALLPAIAAFGGVLAPTAIYLVLNPEPAAATGWSVPTATDVAFTLGILALMGARAPTSLRVFVAALAVIDDIISMVTLAIFYPHAFNAFWLPIAAILGVAMYGLNRWRIYAAWPYIVLAVSLWLALHAAGIHAALAGVILAAFIPTRPQPDAAPLLAQAATALDALEEAQRLDQDGSSARRDSVLSWTRLNLAAASERLLSPAERVEQAVAPWATYVALPLFALAASGVALSVDFANEANLRVFIGVILGLVIGKPLGILAASALAVRLKIGVAPTDVPLRAFIGAAVLCGVGDTVALLMADQAFPDGPLAQAAKVGVFAGSVLAGILGALIMLAPKAPTKTQ